MTPVPFLAFCTLTKRGAVQALPSMATKPSPISAIPAHWKVDRRSPRLRVPSRTALTGISNVTRKMFVVPALASSRKKMTQAKAVESSTRPMIAPHTTLEGGGSRQRRLEANPRADRASKPSGVNIALNATAINVAMALTR